jgi:hypothetical protein
VEGALISSAMLARIAQHQADGQTDADYGVPKGLTLRDEIARYFRIGQAMFKELMVTETPSSAATVNFVEKLLRGVFGFADIRRVDTHTVGDRQFTITFEGLAGRAPVVVAPPADDLDRPSAHLTTDGRRHSAASALQDWLNAGEGALWGLCANGVQLRLIRDNASLTRPAYIEADLRRIFENDAFADFAALWLLIHVSRFGIAGTSPADCALERWRDAGQKEGVTARDKLRDGVEAALLSFGNGFLSHSSNAALRERLHSGALPLPEFFSQLLRLVYRLIFLLAAEDRNLLHPQDTPTGPRKLYAEGYSVGTLRDHAVRRSVWDRHYDRWEGLLVTFVALARGEKRLGLPILGGLFGPDVIRDLEGARLSNRGLMEATFRLAWLREPSGIVPVNWRDMETEELGSVYESLLELTPRLTDDGHGFAFAEGDEAKGHARKTTGSYYTPDSLVQTLLDSALDPVLDRVEAEAADPAAALLSVTILDPACGSGHFLLAAARRIATRLARVRTGGVASPGDYRHALRDAVRSCVYGVDRNPMAVELTKVALWIETVEPGRPLGFLDANILCGDALLGVFNLNALQQGIPDDAYKPLSGDDKETAKHFAARNRAERAGQGSLDFGGGAGRLPAAAPMAGEAKALRAMPEDSPEQIAMKRKQFDAALADPRRWTFRIAADLYIAAFLAPKIGGVPTSRDSVTIPTTANVWGALAGHAVHGQLIGRAQELAGATRVFHWPLEFPDITAAGGFDVVLGNPPWEVMQLSQEEYFAQHLPEIAGLAGAARKRAVAALERDRPDLFASYQRSKRRFDVDREFARASGRFELTARGKVNTYAVFAELSLNLISRRGRTGIIVPTGIATDATTADFFASLILQKRLVSLTDFENSDAIFPAVHRTYRFALLTMGQQVNEAEFRFFLTDPTQLADPERRSVLSAEEISQINPNTKTAPVFRTRADAELVKRIYSNTHILVDDSQGLEGNPWGIEFRQGLFDMFYDSALFRTAAQLIADGYIREGTDWVPIDNAPYEPTDELLEVRGRKVKLVRGRHVPMYEAKMFDQYNHRYADYSSRAGDRGHRVLPEISLNELANVSREAEPFYWVSESELLSRVNRRSYFIGYGEATTASTLRTCVMTAIPFGAVGHKEILLFTSQTAPKEMCLLANGNSLVMDFVVRTKVSYLNLGRYAFKQLPFFEPGYYTPELLNFILPRVIELTYTSGSMTPFARNLGYDGPPFIWNEDRRALLRAELDAWYARAYGLTRDELRYVLDPADVKGPDYPSETFRVLKKTEIARFGEYRTAKLVLAASDAMK